MKGTIIKGSMIVGLLAGTLATQVHAETDYAAVEEKLREIAPGASNIALSETPIEGLLQAQVNSEVIYISSDGDYLVQGTMFEIATRTNLTDQAKAGIRKEALKNMDFEQQIAFTPEDPKYKLLVFTDIDCGYCRKLHNQIEEYMDEGIAIYYMAYPRAGVGSHSFDKFVSVWCSDDQQGALTLAKNGDEPEPLQCDNPIESQYDMGREIGVSGTPALLTMDGTMIPGYMPPEKLRQRLEAIEAEVAAAP